MPTFPLFCLECAHPLVDNGARNTVTLEQHCVHTEPMSTTTAVTIALPHSGALPSQWSSLLSALPSQWSCPHSPALRMDLSPTSTALWHTSHRAATTPHHWSCLHFAPPRHCTASHHCTPSGAARAAHLSSTVVCHPDYPEEIPCLPRCSVVCSVSVSCGHFCFGAAASRSGFPLCDVALAGGLQCPYPKAFSSVSVRQVRLACLCRPGI
jgi:hypothetical protein